MPSLMVDVLLQSDYPHGPNLSTAPPPQDITAARLWSELTEASADYVTASLSFNITL